MSNATTEQIMYLVRFMVEHPDLSCRVLTKTVEGRVRSKELWKELTNELNSLEGAVKTVVQWQKVWTDRKYLTKKAAEAAMRSGTGTGDFSEEQVAIIDLMGFWFSRTNTMGQPLPLFSENDDSSSSQEIKPCATNGKKEKSCTPSTPQENQPCATNSEEERSCTPSIPQGNQPCAVISRKERSSATSIPRVNKRRRLRRRPPPQQDFRSILRVSEAMKRAELTGIRYELCEMKHTLKHLVSELRLIIHGLSNP